MARPYFIIHDANKDREMRGIADSLLQSGAANVTNAGPNLCSVLIDPRLIPDPPKIASGSQVPLHVIHRVMRVATEHAKRICREFPGMLPRGWNFLVEIDDYRNRTTTNDQLHRDDYLPTGHTTKRGGVAFVVLQYLNPASIFGPELIMDIGPGGAFGEVTVPQMLSLPRELIAHVTNAQRYEFEVRARYRAIFVHCPVVPPWGAACFCDPMVFHMSPTRTGPAKTNATGTIEHGSYGGQQTQHKRKLLYFADHPKVKSRPDQDIVAELQDVVGGDLIGLTPVPTSPVHGNLPLSRQLIHTQTAQLRHNTFNVPRNFIRLTYRVAPA